MSGFVSRRREAFRRELTREPSRARRFVAPLYVLMALAGFSLVIFAAPRLTPQTFGFLAVAAGLLVSGLAELGAGGSPGVRAALRLTGFALGVSGLLILVLWPASAGG